MDRGFEEILDECIERMARGATIGDCLAAYPELAAELEPLLQVALAATSASSVEPRPEFRAAARYRFYSAMAARKKRVSKHRIPLLGWRWQWKWVGVVAAVLALFALGGGTVAATSDNVPGEALYGVKIFIERVRLGLAFRDIDRARLNLRFAENRNAEIAEMIRRGNLEEVDELSLRLANHLQEARLAAPGEEGDAQELIGQLEGLANRHLVLLEGLLEQAPKDAQLSIQNLIEGSANNYEDAIRAIGGPMPSIQVENELKGVAANTITGTITITNTSDVDAEVEIVGYALFGRPEVGGWQPLKIVGCTVTPELRRDTAIPAGEIKSFDYDVTFNPPAYAPQELRGIIKVKLVGREWLFYDVGNFSP